MNTRKIIIGSGIVLGVAGIAYLLLRKKDDDDKQPLSPSECEQYGSNPPKGCPGYIAPTAKPKVTSSEYPAGTLLRAGGNDKVYIINAQGQRQWIRTRKKFDNMNLSMKNVISIPAEEMNKIPSGTDLSGPNIVHLLGH